MYLFSRQRAPPPALECPGECSATAQVVQSSRGTRKGRHDAGGGLSAFAAIIAVNFLIGAIRLRGDIVHFQKNIEDIRRQIESQARSQRAAEEARYTKSS